MKCGVCEREFTPKKENKIIVKDVSNLFGVGVPLFWDAFECPDCGCQIIARKHCEKVDENDYLNSLKNYDGLRGDE